jgi:hypothetical protein
MNFPGGFLLLSQEAKQCGVAARFPLHFRHGAPDNDLHGNTI